MFCGMNLAPWEQGEEENSQREAAGRAPTPILRVGVGGARAGSPCPGLQRGRARAHLIGTGS